MRNRLLGNVFKWMEKAMSPEHVTGPLAWAGIMSMLKMLGDKTSCFNRRSRLRQAAT